MFFSQSQIQAKKTPPKLNQQSLFSGLLFAFISASVSATDLETSESSVPVNVQAVQYLEVSQPVVASGPVRPVSEQSLAFKVSGIIGSVLVKEGQFVKKGQPLAKLVLEEIDANVAKAEAVLSDAQRQQERIHTLSGRNMASDQTNRQAKTALEVAQADLRIAKFVRKYAILRAPASGRILTRNIEPNELVQAGQQAFVFADEQQGWSVSLSVADVDIIKLGLGDKVKIRLDAYPKRTFEGVIREMSGRANAHSQTFEVSVVFSEENLPPLYSGLIAHTNITPNQTQVVAKVPLTAFITASGHQGHVYLVKSPTSVELTQVEIAYLSGSSAMITSGLEEGDQIVIDGGPFIVKGSKIEILNQGANTTRLSHTPSH